MPRDIKLCYAFRRRIDRSNKEGTCLWCGKKLRRKRHDNFKPVHENGNVTQVLMEPTYAERLGDYEDDAFCGLRCGYSFGVVMAKLGNRLKPYTGDFV